MSDELCCSPFISSFIKSVTKLSHVKLKEIRDREMKTDINLKKTVNGSLKT